MDLSDNVTTIKGVGPKKVLLLNKLNIFSVEDLIQHYPRGYQDRREVTPLSQLTNGTPALTWAE